MKKIIFGLLVLSLQAAAQNKNIRSLLEDKNFNDLTITLIPVQQELVNECKNYSEFLIANAAELTADSIEFARMLPLRGQMKNTFEADFSLKTPANTEVAKLQKPLIKIKPGSFTQISTGLGLNVPPIEIYSNANGFHLKINSRDVLSDLLANKIEVAASAQVIFSLSEVDSVFLKLFYADITAATKAVLAESDNAFVKAALLGLSYTEIFRSYNLPVAETKENLIFLFSTLFMPGTLDLKENQRVQTSRNLGQIPVLLKAAL